MTLVFNPTPDSNVAMAGAATVTTSVLLPFRSNSRTEPLLNVTLLLKVAVPMAPARPGFRVPSRLIVEVPAPVMEMVPAEKTSTEFAPRLVVPKPVVVRFPPLLLAEPRMSRMEAPPGPEMLMLPGDDTAPNRVVPVFVAAMLTGPAALTVTNPVVVDVLTLTGSAPVPMAPVDEVCKNTEPSVWMPGAGAAACVMLPCAVIATDAVTVVLPVAVEALNTLPIRAAPPEVTSMRPAPLLTDTRSANPDPVCRVTLPPPALVTCVYWVAAAVFRLMLPNPRLSALSTSLIWLPGWESVKPPSLVDDHCWVFLTACVWVMAPPAFSVTLPPCASMPCWPSIVPISNAPVFLNAKFPLRACPAIRDTVWLPPTAFSETEVPSAFKLATVMRPDETGCVMAELVIKLRLVAFAGDIAP